MESTLEEDEGGKNLEEEMHRWRQRTNEAAATAKKLGGAKTLRFHGQG